MARGTNKTKTVGSVGPRPTARGGRPSAAWRRVVAAGVGVALGVIGWGPVLSAQAATTAVTPFGVDLNSTLVGSSATYTVTFQTGTTAALPGGSGTVTLAAATGTVWPSDAASYSVNDISNPGANGIVAIAPTVTSGGAVVTVTVPSTVAAGDVVQVVAQGVQNPSTASGADTLGISTSADAAAATATYSIFEPASISGTVSDANGPVAGATVDVTGPSYSYAATGPGGTYTVTGLEPGAYRVEFSAPGDTSLYYPSTDNFIDATPVDVGPGASLTGISATLSALPTGSISGTVTSGGTGLSGVCVTASNGEGPNWYAETGSGGTYTISNVPASDYEVSFGGYCNSSSPATPVVTVWYPGNATSQSLAGPVAVAGGQAVTGIDAQVTEVSSSGGTGSITGTVSGAGGRPLADICVDAQSGNITTAASAATAANGSYTLTGLAAGTYDVSFSPCFGGGEAVNYVGTDLAATVATSPVTLDAQLQPGGTIIGKVTDSSGDPVQGVTVEAFSNNQPYYAYFYTPYAVSGSSGTFVLTGLPDNNYYLSVGGSGYAYANYGQSSDGTGQLDITSAQPLQTGVGVQLQQAGSISGHVTNSAGQPVVGACVFAFLPGSNVLSIFAQTDLNGYYRVPDLAPGTGYGVSVEGCGSEPSDVAGMFYALSNTPASIDVAAGQTASAPSTQLSAGGEIDGTVTANGQPAAAGVCVEASPVGSPGSVEGTGFTDATGAYRIGALPVGNYTVSFGSCNTSQFSPNYYDNQPSIGSANPVAVVSGTPATGIDADLLPLSSVSSTSSTSTPTTVATTTTSPGSTTTTTVATTPVATPVPNVVPSAPVTTAATPVTTASSTPTSSALPPASSPAPPPPFANPASYPKVGTSVMYSSSTGGTVTSSVGQANMALSIPPGALPSGTTVSVYDGNATALSEQLQAGTVVTGFAVSWKTPAGTTPPASKPLTMTIYDPSIKAGDIVYEQTYGGGLEAVGEATVDGQVTITFTIDPSFVVVSPAKGGAAALQGYSLVGANGSVFAYGRAKYRGSAAKEKLVSPVIGAFPTPDGNGYWLVTKKGGVFSYGDAHFYGSLAGLKLSKPVVAIAATPDGKGYWLALANGRVFAFGDARRVSPPQPKLGSPVVGMMVDEATGGYWLLTADGGVFAYHAPFFGSAAKLKLASPVVGGASLPDGTGYWLAGAGGGVFSFGKALYKGSASGKHLSGRVVGIVGDGGPGGYWLVGADGGIFAFGTARYHGSPTGKTGGHSVVAGLG